MSPAPCKCQEAGEGSGHDVTRGIALVRRELPAWRGMPQHSSRPEAEAASVLRHFWDFFSLLFFFFFISFQETGWRQRFPPEHAWLTQPCLTQPCPLTGAERQQGCRDRREGSGQAWGAECGLCHGNCDGTCRVFVPAGFCSTGSIPQR